MTSLILLTLSYALWGLFVGLMVGFTAIGNGLIGTPGLILLFGLSPLTAVGTIALSGFITMLTSTIQHLKKGNINLRIALPFSVTALPVSFFCALYADEINDILPLRVIIGVVIILSTILLTFKFLIMKSPERDPEVKKWQVVLTPFLGLLLGTLMGATSISGSIIVIAFLIILKLPTPMAIGTTSFVAAISLFVASLAHIQQGHIDWFALAGLVPGVIVGVLLGVHFIDKVPRQALRISILMILVLAGISVIFKG